MVIFRCKDLGLACSFETTGTSPQDILRQYIRHAETEHGIKVLSAEMIYRIQRAIRSEQPGLFPGILPPGRVIRAGEG